MKVLSLGELKETYDRWTREEDAARVEPLADSLEHGDSDHGTPGS